MEFLSRSTNLRPGGSASGGSASILAVVVPRSRCSCGRAPTTAPTSAAAPRSRLLSPGAVGASGHRSAVESSGKSLASRRGPGAGRQEPAPSSSSASRRSRPSRTRSWDQPGRAPATEDTKRRSRTPRSAPETNRATEVKFSAGGDKITARYDVDPRSRSSGEQVQRAGRQAPPEPDQPAGDQPARPPRGDPAQSKGDEPSDVLRGKLGADKVPGDRCAWSGSAPRPESSSATARATSGRHRDRSLALTSRSGSTPVRARRRHRLPPRRDGRHRRVRHPHKEITLSTIAE